MKSASTQEAKIQCGGESRVGGGGGLSFLFSFPFFPCKLCCLLSFRYFKTGSVGGGDRFSGPVEI